MQDYLPQLEKQFNAAYERGDMKEAQEIAQAIKEVQAVIAARETNVGGSLEAAKRRQVAPSTKEYLVDRLKKGAGEGVGTVAFVMDAATGGANPHQTAENYKDKVQGNLGFENLSSPGTFSTILGAGAEALTDPLSYLLGPQRSVLSPLKNAAESVIPSMAGKTGELVAKGSDYETAASIGAGILGGLSQNTAKNVAKGALKAVAVKSGLNKAQEGVASKIAEETAMLAHQHTRNVVQAMADADPDLVKNLQSLLARNNAINVNLPVTAAGDNPVIKAAVHEMSQDPSFVAAFSKQFDEARQALEAKAAQEFGDPVKSKEIIEAALSEYAKTAPDVMDLLRRQASTAANKDLEASLAGRKLAGAYAGPNAEVRSRLRLSNVQPTSSNEAKQFWNTADGIAQSEKAMIPPNQVKGIYGLVVSEKGEQPFQRFPKILNLVTEKLRPNDNTSFMGEGIQASGKDWKALDFNDFRSLQSEIAAEIRGLSKNSPTFSQDMANLTMLEQKVNEAAKASFSPKLLDALDTARKQTAWDYVLKDMGKKIFNDKGILDFKALEDWLADSRNQGAVQRMVNPSTGESLKGLTKNAQEMTAKILREKNDLDSVVTKAVQQEILSLSNMTPQQIVNKAYQDTRFTQDFLEKFGKQPPVLNALRAWMLDDLIIKPGAVETIVGDKNKVATIDRVFGFGYRAKLQQLADVADKLQSNTAREIPYSLASTPKDLVEQRINVPASQIFSKFRNPIISTKQAVFELASKAISAQADKGFEKELKAILLDPQRIASVVKELDEVAKGKSLDMSGETAKAVLKWAAKHPQLWNYLKNTGKEAALGGGRGYLAGERNE